MLQKFEIRIGCSYEVNVEINTYLNLFQIIQVKLNIILFDYSVNNVTHIGLTDLPYRLPTLYGNNIPIGKNIA